MSNTDVLFSSLIGACAGLIGMMAGIGINAYFNGVACPSCPTVEKAQPVILLEGLCLQGEKKSIYLPHNGGSIECLAGGGIVYVPPIPST